jgi:hypothetical protein
VRLSGSGGSGVPLGQGGSEVGHCGGQGEQVTGGGGEGGQKVHGCLSDRWRVVRGGRSVLTEQVCGCQARGDRALACALQAPSVEGPAARLYAGLKRTAGARRAHGTAHRGPGDRGKD